MGVEIRPCLLYTAPMNRRAYVSIDLKALDANVARIKHFAPRSKLMAIVKANAYGHGVTQIAKALSKVDALGVATVGEALELREIQIEKPLVVLEGFLTPKELMTASRHSVLFFIHHLFQIEIIEKTPLQNPISVWIKVDTGMNRLGIAPGDIKDAFVRLQKCASVKNIMGLATHLASADEAASAQTTAQLQLFDSISRELNLNGAEHTLANSAGILAWPESHATWVRPGIALYGVSPFLNKGAAAFGLNPVMSFHSTLIATQEIEPDETVGYGASWQAKRRSKIGIVACGYADGYPRHAKNGMPVLVGGKRMPLVGRVSMDMLAVDLTQYPNTPIGTPVELWGKSLPIEEVAKHANTIPYELLCRMSQARVCNG